MTSSSKNKMNNDENGFWIFVFSALSIMILLFSKCTSCNAMSLDNQAYSIVTAVNEEKVDWTFANDSIFVDAPEEGFVYPCVVSGNNLTYFVEDIFVDSACEVLSYLVLPILGNEVLSMMLVSHYYIHIPFGVEYYDDIEVFTLIRKKDVLNP